MNIGRIKESGGEGGIRTPGTGFGPYNGLANSRSHTLLFGINNLCSGEMPYVCAKPPCLGPSVQLLCNRYFALNTQKMIAITRTFRPACSTLLLRKARFSPKWITSALPVTRALSRETRPSVCDIPTFWSTVGQRSFAFYSQRRKLLATLGNCDGYLCRALDRT